MKGLFIEVKTMNNFLPLSGVQLHSYEVSHMRLDTALCTVTCQLSKRKNIRI